ncbi:hypothetical protein FQN57_006898 [Myotisia sp. PD_48]|nr:hypothetical protein FQN57_006898 [Myotisia sp. PD_48]
MPASNNAKPFGFKMSFADVFKSSKALREERDLAAYKRELLKNDNKRLAELQASLPQMFQKNAQSQPAASKEDVATKTKSINTNPAARVETNTNGTRVTPDASGWSADDDAQLLELKSGNPPWKNIAVQMNRSIEDIKNRWHVVRPDPSSKPVNAELNKTADKRENLAGAAKDSKKQNQVSFVEPETSGNKPSTKKIIYYTDDNFTLEEVILLNKLAENFIPLALVAGPVAVSAAGTLGFALGVKNPDGSCKKQADFEEDFEVLKVHTNIVRTYAAADCNNAEAIVPAAKKKNFKLVLGIWPDVEESFQKDTQALKKAVPGNEDVISAITVGSETLYRGNFTGPELLAKIQQVQKMFPSIRVGTADSWNKYADGTADALIQGGVKYFLINAFAFWQGQDIKNATATFLDDMFQASGHIQRLAGEKAKDIYIATGETGWPSDGGSNYGQARAGTANAKTFHDEGICAMLGIGGDVFYFEAFDEPWKPASIGDNGKAADETHWGMYTADRKEKFKAVAEPWSDINSSKLVLAALDETEGSTFAAKPACPDVQSSFRPAQPSIQDFVPSARRLVTPSAATIPVVTSAVSTPNGSPAYPSLPILRRPDRALDSAPVSPDNKRTDSSTYYTTAWGSPYATPSTRRLSGSRGDKLRGLDAELLEASPLASQNVTQGQSINSVRSKPAPCFFERDLQGDPTTHAGKSIKDFTQDWINQYMSGKPRSERTNWLSDDSADSEVASFLTARNHPGDDSDSWLDLDDKLSADDPLKTPIASKLLKGRIRLSPPEKNRLFPRKVKHVPKASTDTLRQSDFWDCHDLVAMSTPEPLFISTLDGVDPQLSISVSPVEKPLPQPPAEETPNAGIQDRQAQLKPANASLPRPKKKVVTRRGKYCVIALPVSETRGTEEGAALLTPEDVERIYRSWEEKGYDVRGTGIDDPVSLGIQSREVYPITLELQLNRADKQYVIRFPDQDEWERYVSFLKEEKLRALGVSLGDPEPTDSISPALASAPMSHSSSQFMGGQTISPPIPTSSASSHHLNMLPSPFSPAFNQSTKATSNMGSITSPSSPFGFITDSPFQPQNLTFGNEGVYPFLPFHPTPPTQGAPNLHNLYGIHPGGILPVTGGNMPNLGSMLHPVSPLVSDDANQFPGTTINMQSQYTNSFAKSIHQPHDIVLNTLESPPTEESTVEPEPETDAVASGPEIAHPTPRGHRQNVSQTLQKGVERAEYQFEHSIRQQLEDEQAIAENSLMSSRWAVEADEQSSFFSSGLMAQSGRLQEQLLAKHPRKENGIDDGSDIDTNPSLQGPPSPIDDYTTCNQFADHTHEQKPKANSLLSTHRPENSVPKLNVAAKSFDPTRSFSPSNFSFASKTFQPNFSSHDASRSLHNSNHSHGNSNSAHMTGFEPSAAKQQLPNFDPSNSNFKFSAATFNVAAPVFNPGASFTFGMGQENHGPRAKIFESSTIVRPAKESKAIPIVKPDVPIVSHNTNQSFDNEPSRSGAQGREKRARRIQGVNEGEEEQPVYAASPIGISTPEPVEATSDGISRTPDQNRKRTVGETIEQAVSAGQDDARYNEWKPFEFQNKTDAATFNEVLPSTAGNNPFKHNQQRHSRLNSTASTVLDRSIRHIIEDHDHNGQSKSSALKPTATPFEFVPASSHVGAPEPARTPEPAPRKKTGLKASRYAVSVSPEPIKYVSDQVSLQSMGQLDVNVQDSSDEDNIDAVMKQLNDGDSSIGVERLGTPLPLQSVFENISDKVIAPKLVPSSIARSNAPSPSLHANQSLDETSRHPPTLALQRDPQSPVRQLNSHVQEHISDWDDAISSGEDEEFHHRTRFFETHVDKLIGASLDGRLAPLERSLGAIRQSLALIGSQNVSKQQKAGLGTVEHSDADDEDEEGGSGYRSRSPLNKQDRLAEKIKNIVVQALSINQPLKHEVTPTVDLSEVTSSLAEMKSSIESVTLQHPPESLKDVLSEVISAHALQLNHNQPIDTNADEAEKFKLQLDGLQSMLRLADERADNEYNSRRAAQDALAEVTRKLELVEVEVAIQREEASAAMKSLEEFKNAKVPEMERAEQQSKEFQEQQHILRLTLSELSEKNISLEGRLDEYRVSGDHFRIESERTKVENADLHRTIEILKTQLEENIDNRQKLGERFDKLQEDMMSVTRDVALEQAQWRKKEEDQVIKYNSLVADYVRETKQRQKLEAHINELEEKEREGAKLKFILGQSQEENAKLEELLMTVRQESHDYQNKAARFERDFNEALKNSHVETQRVRILMGADLDAANHRVTLVRSELEAQISNFQNALNTASMDGEAAKAKYETILKDTLDSKNSALQEATASKDQALQDQRLIHERTLNDLRERHARAMHNASEDRQRDESHYMEVMALRDEKIDHLQDKVDHLEERLQIATAAARAAAEAAQKAKPAPVDSPVQTTLPSMAFAQGSTIPDKISPQALRESIMVLQDQLQQREARIEELEQELSIIDRDAPATVKEKETEINWLRELLSVRVDDLQDIITVLSRPSFDQNSVRDAAIRLKANLQMQMQERERTMSGTRQQFPSLASISNLASSPRALPLAAAAAWGNWRKAREGSLASIITTTRANSSADDLQTPSKTTSDSQGFLSGLMTPPGSNVRDHHPRRAPTAARQNYSQSRPLRSNSNTNISNSVSSSRSGSGNTLVTPTTPPLLHKSSYDRDAEENIGYGGEYADDSDSMFSGIMPAPRRIRPNDGPFGPEI